MRVHGECTVRVKHFRINCTGIIRYCIWFGTCVNFSSLLLTHALQGYSSCVCVSGSIFPNSDELAKKNYGSPQRCSRLIYNVGFFIKQPLREDAEFEWQPYWCTGRPFCLLLQAPERIPIHVTLFWTTWCFCYGLCHCVWRDAV